MGVIETVRRWPVTARLIAVNGVVFLVLRLAVIAGLFAGVRDVLPSVLSMVELPGSPMALARAPWTVITYMFAQYDILHLFFNMVWLWWFGSIFMFRCSGSQLFVLYLYGGLAGALLFIAACVCFPFVGAGAGRLIGSSAAVMAIVTATAVLMPDFGMRLLLFGEVKLKWIALVSILLVLIGVTGDNAGGEMAHVGGILVGLLFGMRLRHGQDITAPVRRLVSGRDRRQRRPVSPSSTSSPQRELDEILDKIRRSGYSSLTADERRRLFDVSKKL
ncbi:MAG: rhomboid family intramembrane serine protease [Duncaniella sp.]|nr:rhomboid family intramembrane serine protease [Duncaniella sp.]